MFEPGPGPRLFGLPPGADFAARFVAGLLARTRGMPPEALARVQIHVNAGRMLREIRAAFDAHGARLLPRLRIVTDLAADTPLPGLPPPVPALRRRLELAHLVRGLIDADPTLAPRASIHDLAESLAGLLDEMQNEGVRPDALRRLDVQGRSAHWERSLKFLDIVAGYATTTYGAPDLASRQRAAALALARLWEERPPDHPVLMVGSTGSRGATLELMKAVARLPQGAVVLPGFDFDQPQHVWDRLENAMTGEDHPQFRHARVAAALGLSPRSIRSWAADAPVPARNRLVSLALRPAPVTDQWMREGRALDDLAAATADMTLVEAPSPRIEAAAIALRLRQAVADGQRAALITPDRNLTRRVTALLDRWGIEPDDSGGRPLALSAPGRLLRHVADLLGQPLTPAALLTILKHPLVRCGSERGAHLLHTRRLELHLRRHGPAFPTSGDLQAWAARRTDDPARAAWAGRLSVLTDLADGAPALLSGLAARHLAAAEALCRGPDGSSELWEQEAGLKAQSVMADLVREAPHGGEIGTPRLRRPRLEPAGRRAGPPRRAPAPRRDDLGHARGARGRRRPRDPRRPERRRLARRARARSVAQPADAPRRRPAPARAPDRPLGARLPAGDRRARGHAHPRPPRHRGRDRALPLAQPGDEPAGRPARSRGRRRARGHARPRRRLARPCRDARPHGPEHPARSGPRHNRRSRHGPGSSRSPRSPASSATPTPSMPAACSASSGSTRSPANPTPRCAARCCTTSSTASSPPCAPARRSTPGPSGPSRPTSWPARCPGPPPARSGRPASTASPPWFVATEAVRQAEGAPALQEKSGAMPFADLGFTLTARPDRIDALTSGGYAVYDYKTGTPPSEKQVRAFDKQLLLEAMMAEAGAFPDLPADEVRRLAYIGLGARPLLREIPLGTGDAPLHVADVRAEFRRLIEAFARRDQGYTARRAMHETRFAGDFDHLARYGEWDDSTRATPEVVG